MELGYLDILYRLLAAILCGGIVGYEREAHRHPAGLRTHILVCTGAAVVAIIECMTVAWFTEESARAGVGITVGRMTAQVVSGIGFLGAGTIITTKRNIAGLTTAASLWGVGCLGIAAGMGYYQLVALGTASVLIVLTLIKRLIVGHFYRIVEITFLHRKETLAFLNDYFASHHIRVQSVDFRIEGSADGVNTYTNVYTLDIPRKLSVGVIANDIAEFANVRKIRTREP